MHTALQKAILHQYRISAISADPVVTFSRLEQSLRRIAPEQNSAFPVTSSTL
jgi:hypothetical protein